MQLRAMFPAITNQWLGMPELLWSENKQAISTQYLEQFPICCRGKAGTGRARLQPCRQRLQRVPPLAAQGTHSLDNENRSSIHQTRRLAVSGLNARRCLSVV